MKVLWFSASAPSRFTGAKKVIAGWQDSLEQLVRKGKDIELAVAFPIDYPTENKTIDGVCYFPLCTHLTFSKRLRSRISAYVLMEKQIQKALKVIDDFSPDVIQVFGTEFGYGLIAKYTSIPVVVHIQGAMIPYNNAIYPPGYNGWTYFKAVKGNPLRLLNNAMISNFRDSRVEMEKEVWNHVNYYMGRTSWDKAVSEIFHPGRSYFHVEEALRPMFLSDKWAWKLPVDGKLKLLSTGCSTLWKGLDMMLKTAKELKRMKVDFEWNVCGSMPNEHRMMVEYHEKLTFKQAGINLLGMTPPDRLTEFLCSSTMYVHTSYIDNSPNSICEAQRLGVPVISTNVGGISTLVRDGIDGILVPANDPYQMAYHILSLSKDMPRMKEMSEKGKAKAMERHNPGKILDQLKECYSSILQS